MPEHIVCQGRMRSCRNLFGDLIERVDISGASEKSLEENNDKDEPDARQEAKVNLQDKQHQIHKLQHIRITLIADRVRTYDEYYSSEIFTDI